MFLNDRRILPGGGLSEMGAWRELGEDQLVFQIAAHLIGGHQVRPADDFIVHHAAGFIHHHIHHDFADASADSRRWISPWPPCSGWWGTSEVSSPRKGYMGIRHMLNSATAEKMLPANGSAEDASNS